MFTFQSDYDCPPHPLVASAIAASWQDWSRGSYGKDKLSAKARGILSCLFTSVNTLGVPCEAFFVPTGTAANRLALAVLTERSYHAILCSKTAHINVHEAGSAESLGHKLILLEPDSDGKISRSAVQEVLLEDRDVHNAQPHVLALSNATELGTVYSEDELLDVRRGNWYIAAHLDGARLANAAARLGWKNLSHLVGNGAFQTISLGMAKNGGGRGDVLMVWGKERIEAARRYHKQFGYSSSRTQEYAAQVIALFEGDLWLENARLSNALATLLGSRLTRDPNIGRVFPVQTNAVFARVPSNILCELEREGWGCVWDRRQGVMRFMCSYSTTSEDVDALMSTINNIVTK